MRAHELPRDTIHFAHDLRRETAWPLIESGLWLRVGFIGASSAAVAVLLLFTGEARPLIALASALAGGVLAAFSWRRSWVLLDRIDGSQTATKGAMSPATDQGATGDNAILTMIALHR